MILVNAGIQIHHNINRRNQDLGRDQDDDYPRISIELSLSHKKPDLYNTGREEGRER